MESGSGLRPHIRLMDRCALLQLSLLMPGHTNATLQSFGVLNLDPPAPQAPLQPALARPLRSSILLVRRVPGAHPWCATIMQHFRPVTEFTHMANSVCCINRVCSPSAAVVHGQSIGCRSRCASRILPRFIASTRCSFFGRSSKVAQVFSSLIGLIFLYKMVEQSAVCEGHIPRVTEPPVQPRVLAMRNLVGSP